MSDGVRHTAWGLFAAAGAALIAACAPTATPPPSAVGVAGLPTAVSTVGWRTYHSSVDRDLAFQYPPSWHVSDKGPGEGLRSGRQEHVTFTSPSGAATVEWVSGASGGGTCNPIPTPAGSPRSCPHWNVFGSDVLSSAAPQRYLVSGAVQEPSGTGWYPYLAVQSSPDPAHTGVITSQSALDGLHFVSPTSGGGSSALVAGPQGIPPSGSGTMLLAEARTFLAGPDTRVARAILASLKTG